MAIYLGTNKVDLGGTNGGFMLNGHLIATKTYSFNLGQTNFSSITPTTSTQTLTLPATAYSTNGGTTITCLRLGEDYDGTLIDRTAYDYVVFQKYEIDFNYGTNNVSSMIHGIRSTGARDYHVGKYLASIVATTGILTETLSTSAGYINSISPLLYQKADGTYAMTTSQGIYGSTTPASVSTSNGKNYIDLKYGNVYIKYSDSYFPLAALQALNPTNTIFTVTWEIYEGDKSMYSYIYDTAYSLAANH